MNLLRSILNTKKDTKSPVSFSHCKALAYEMKSAEQHMLNDYKIFWEKIEQAKIEGRLNFPGPKNHFFDNEKTSWKNFVKHCRNRKSLEIGPGPVGNILQWFWLSKRVVIDPLAYDYQQFQIKHFGNTLFSKDIKIYNQEAESLIPELVNRVSGCIISRNVLDHMKDPLKAVANMAQYAKKGCYLLFWTDLWHLDGVDEGHQNITKSVGGFRALIEGLGFKIICELNPVRKDGSTIEYGCRAIKNKSVKRGRKKVFKIDSHDLV